MSAPVPGRPRRRLAALATVPVAALLFAILLILVRLRWAPLESVDHGAASRTNRLVAGDHPVVTVVKAVTWLGSDVALVAVIAAAVVYLVIRKRWRLAVYLLAAGAGALVLNPVLKTLVGRLRPVVAHPIAYGTGDSFPSGHTMSATICYGAVLLVFLPAARGRLRTALITVIAVVVVLVGISRILLGVHYLSDVIAGWAIGIAWLGVTAFAFELTRLSAGRPVTDPVTQGLEPEARADLRPAQPASGAGGARGRHYGRTAAAIVVIWVLILGVITGLGKLITRQPSGNVLGDRTIPHWFAAHRTPTLTTWSLVFTTAGGTVGIVAVGIAVSVVFIAVSRNWRPVIYLAVLLAGELSAFLIAAAVVKRPRPDVTHLDHRLPTSAYPSGHTAAACCLYIGLAILVVGHARGWWRWLFLIPAIAMPALVALSRIYRGEHHPTDVAGSIVFAALWLPAVFALVRPNADSRRPGRPRTQALPDSERKGAAPGAERLLRSAG
jgi:undecaprenyl-diphosphatase